MDFHPLNITTTSNSHRVVEKGELVTLSISFDRKRFSF